MKETAKYAAVITIGALAVFGLLSFLPDTPGNGPDWQAQAIARGLVAAEAGLSARDESAKIENKAVRQAWLEGYSRWCREAGRKQ